MKWLSALAAAILCAASSAHADPLKGDSLPANTRWVIHVDADGMRLAPPLWNLARQRIVEPRRDDLLPKVELMQRVTGMKLPQDLHDATLFGTSFDPASACLRIHGSFVAANVRAALALDPEFREAPHNQHTIMSWRDKNADRLLYGTFAKPDLALISSSNKALADALDVIDGKARPLAAESPLAPPPLDGAAPQHIVWLAGENISDLPRAQMAESPLLVPMDAASISLRWVNEKALAEIRVTAKTEKAAQEMQTVAESMKIMVTWSAAAEHATARNRLFASMLQSFSTEVAGKTVKGAWPLELDRVELLLATLQPEPVKAVTAPAKQNP
jgi:hypothetical protein